MNDLQFIRTVSIQEFKTLNNVSSIEIVKSPKTGKIFFVAGSITGACTEYQENPVISEVVGTEGVTFWLMHKKATQNTLAVL